jgi:hypothetical protein
VEVSLIASSVRPQLYDSFFDSLKGTSVKYWVNFAGNLTGCGDMDDCAICDLEAKYPLHYKATRNIKPAQCYEIARRDAEGEVIVWVADDCEFPNDVIGKAYRYWKSMDDEKLVLSIQTKEADAFRGEMHLVNMRVHSFFGGRPETGLMAPLGMMSREYAQRLGGFHRDFIGNQAENDIVMRVYADGGGVQVFGDKETYIEIDHHRKHGGPRVLHTFYPEDRRVLESAWVEDRVIVRKRLLPFLPYEDKDILIKSQGNTKGWPHD